MGERNPTLYDTTRNSRAQSETHSPQPTVDEHSITPSYMNTAVALIPVIGVALFTQFGLVGFSILGLIVFFAGMIAISHSTSPLDPPGA